MSELLRYQSLLLLCVLDRILLSVRGRRSGIVTLRDELLVILLVNRLVKASSGLCCGGLCSRLGRCCWLSSRRTNVLCSKRTRRFFGVALSNELLDVLFGGVK
jgi:hypothetical protein